MTRAEELKAQGNEAFANKEFKKAAKIYRDAIKLDSTNAILYSNRAQCFIKENDWNRALRDCNDGLSLKPNTKTKIKLMYRKGVVCKNLGDALNARDCISQVLKEDPANKAAINELKELEASIKENISEIPNAIEIPVVEVDRLPEEFRKLTERDIKEPTHSSNLEPTSRLENEINDLFGNKKPRTEQKASANTESVPFAERLTMKALLMLNTLPENQKVGAYKYIITLSPDYYYDIFGSTGIESEFLKFFMEAAAYISSHNVINNWQTEIYELIFALSKLRRYEISLLFCSKDHIKEILDNVNNLGDEVMLNQYQKLLT